MIIWALVILPGVALALTLFNLRFWPRGRAGGSMGPVSVLIPARNEERNLAATLEALREAQGPIAEILVYDDASTDRTSQILAECAALDPRIRVLRGAGLPTGWIGKTHACHRLAEAAQSNNLLFLDSDVRWRRQGLAHLAGLVNDYQADLVTAVPAQELGSFVERLVLPLLHLTYTSWLPLPLIWRSSNPRFLAANGQVLWVSRQAYLQTGGFEAVRGEVVDDMAFCRRAKQAGLRVVFADGTELATCRMYTSAKEVVAGFSKNFYEGIGGSRLALLFVLGLYFSAFVAPFLLLPLGLFWPQWLAPAAMAVGINLVLRGALAVRFAHPWWSTLLQPLGVLVLLGIGLNSYRWHRRGRIEWRGRAYPGKRERIAAEGAT
ncbi:MAG: glycosyltransferase [Deltaproteobacteria bacterium]|nr:glycosyltransferase [Deltaproteobacteria bacterium]